MSSPIIVALLVVVSNNLASTSVYTPSTKLSLNLVKPPLTYYLIYEYTESVSKWINSSTLLLLDNNIDYKSLFK